jgi:putative membrane protein
MNTPRRVWVPIVILGLAGASLCVALFVHHGIADVGHAVKAAGWGVAAVLACHLVPMFFDMLGWRALLLPRDRLPLGRLYLIRWIGDSISSMLPVAQVGGEIVRVRLAAKWGITMSIAIASVLVNMTISVFTQIPFTLSALGILIILTHRSNLTMPLLVVCGLGVLATVGFFAVQRAGMFRIAAVIISHVIQSSAWKGLIDKAHGIDQDVRGFYSRRSALGMSSLWMMCCWAAGAVEVWIALRALGKPGTYAQSFVMEGVSQGIRSAAFLVPGALGVQEGGYLAVGTMLGFSSETALALAMIRRVRELAFGIPGLLAWQFVEWSAGTEASASVEVTREAA